LASSFGAARAVHSATILRISTSFVLAHGWSPYLKLVEKAATEKEAQAAAYRKSSSERRAKENFN
jgi:hypothetical protein